MEEKDLKLYLQGLSNAIVNNNATQLVILKELAKINAFNWNADFETYWEEVKKDYEKAGELALNNWKGLAT